MEIFSTILAGGNGTRFWPLSRKNMPKQLLSFNGSDVMLNETIKRCNGLIKYDNTIVVTSNGQAELLKNMILSEIPGENIIVEPALRNTAPCIALAAAIIRKRLDDCDRDAIMIVLPSDHHIDDDVTFRKVLQNACRIAEECDKLVTIGIKPTFPSTGYGYIKHNSHLKGYPYKVYEVLEFVEKPAYEKAAAFIQDGAYMWNSGIFVWRVSTILENFKRYLPRIYKAMNELSGFIGTDDQDKAMAAAYKGMQNISVDYGILERSDETVVIPGEFGWSDLGSWDVLGTIFPSDDNGNIIKASHISLDTNNSIIYCDKKLVATIGIDNMIIVDTEDALLICSKQQAQKVKKLVDKMKDTNLEKYL